MLQLWKKKGRQKDRHIITINSPKTLLEPEIPGDIILFTQFYLDKNPEHRNEIIKTLHFNLRNKHINKIYLLNERIYSLDELQIPKDSKYLVKLEQVNICKRLQYRDIYDFVEEQKVNGYIIIANADIIFDETLEVLPKTGLANKKKVFCQLRHNMDKQFNYEFLVYGFSQDAWIYHSIFNVKKEFRSKFQIYLGNPGCDNKLVYLYNNLGFKTYNEPKLIKIYHNHKTEQRAYLYKPLIGILCHIIPYIEK